MSCVLPGETKEALRTAGLLVRSAAGALKARRRPWELCTQRIILFTRYPQPGATKTRLIGALGERAAADLQRRMTEHAFRQAAQAARQAAAALEVRCEGGSSGLMRAWLGDGARYRAQAGRDLGERMHGAFRGACREGARRMVLMGADCPDLGADQILAALDALGRCDVVLGPAHDGGYYLVALRRPQACLFRDMPWGTPGVLQRTLATARAAGLRVHLLERLADMDRPEDLRRWDSDAFGPLTLPAAPRISVVIPTLNEEGNLDRALAAVLNARNVEVVVADGGSTYGTACEAKSLGARVLVEKGGRGAQLNAGAAVARGELLVFLHADTLLPPGWDAWVRQALAQRGNVLGAFELAIDGQAPGLRTVEQWVNWRSRGNGLPYGDQALFLSSGFFRSLGGFRQMPLMEDYEFVQRARKAGQVVIQPTAVLTSDRRWRRLGVFRTTLTNHFIVLAYRLGVPPGRLARWYRGLG